MNEKGNAEYELTINVEICFDYYPLRHSFDSEDNETTWVDTTGNTEYYCENEDITLTITPKMLIDAIIYVYADSKKQLNLEYERSMLEYALNQCPYLFTKLCAEIFDEENLDEWGTHYVDYLKSTDEYKKKERNAIENACYGLGELYD